MAIRGGGARAGGRAGWLRAGPASLRGGKAGGRAAQPPAGSLAPSLPRWVSQSVRPRPASLGVAEGRSLGRRHLLLPLFIRQLQRAVGAGPRFPVAPVRRGGCSVLAGLREAGRRSCPRGDGPGGRGGAAASLSPARRRQAPGRGLWLCGLGCGRLRGCRRDAAAPGERGGAGLGERFEVRLGIGFFGLFFFFFDAGEICVGWLVHHCGSRGRKPHGGELRVSGGGGVVCSGRALSSGRGSVPPWRSWAQSEGWREPRGDVQPFPPWTPVSLNKCAHAEGSCAVRPPSPPRFPGPKG